MAYLHSCQEHILVALFQKKNKTDTNTHRYTHSDEQTHGRTQNNPFLLQRQRRE